ncbi:hypothetical protein Tco_0356182 [Tanacetum coccineum]
MGPLMSTGKPLTQEEAEREALAISICERHSLLEEERPVIKTMAYNDKYKKILDKICLDKMKLYGMNKEEEEAIIKIKGEALIEKEDPRAFVIPIRLEGKINLNALAETGSDINVMPYRVYKELGREEVSVITIIAKFLILYMPINRDTPILVGRGFLHTYGNILNTIDKITSTFDGICHQTFHAAKTSLDTGESDSDDEEDDPLDQSLALQEVLNPFRKICVWKKVVSFIGSLPVALQHVKWKPDYSGCFNKKNEDLDTTTLRELIDSEGRLIPEAPQPGRIVVSAHNICATGSYIRVTNGTFNGILPALRVLMILPAKLTKDVATGKVFDAVALFHEAEAEAERVCRVQSTEKSKPKVCRYFLFANTLPVLAFDALCNAVIRKQMKCPPTLSGASLDGKEGSITIACKFIFEEVTSTFVALLLKEPSTASSNDRFQLWYSKTTEEADTKDTVSVFLDLSEEY